MIDSKVPFTPPVYLRRIFGAPRSSGPGTQGSNRGWSLGDSLQGARLRAISAGPRKWVAAMLRLRGSLRPLPLSENKGALTGPRKGLATFYAFRWRTEQADER